MLRVNNKWIIYEANIYNEISFVANFFGLFSFKGTNWIKSSIDGVLICDLSSNAFDKKCNGNRKLLKCHAKFQNNSQFLILKSLVVIADIPLSCNNFY